MDARRPLAGRTSPQGGQLRQALSSSDALVLEPRMRIEIHITPTTNCIGSLYRARYYDPGRGRFVSEDPIGLAGGGLNYYGYADDDPIDETDPLGLSSCGCSQSGFRTNFTRNLHATNQSFFGFPWNFTKTGIGVALGAGRTISGTVGTVRAGQALSSVLLRGAGVANLTIPNTLISAAVNSGLTGLAVGVALEAGIITGSAIDATMKSMGIDLSGCN